LRFFFVIIIYVTFYLFIYLFFEEWTQREQICVKGGGERWLTVAFNISLSCAGFIFDLKPLDLRGDTDSAFLFNTCEDEDDDEDGLSSLSSRDSLEAPMAENDLVMMTTASPPPPTPPPPLLRFSSLPLWSNLRSFLLSLILGAEVEVAMRIKQSLVVLLAYGGAHCTHSYLLLDKGEWWYIPRRRKKEKDKEIEGERERVTEESKEQYEQLFNIIFSSAYIFKSP
jgi:hypothetical protein